MEILPFFERRGFLENLADHLSAIYKCQPELHETIVSSQDHWDYDPTDYARVTLSMHGKSSKPHDVYVLGEIGRFIFTYYDEKLAVSREDRHILALDDGFYTIFPATLDETIHINANRIPLLEKWG